MRHAFIIFDYDNDLAAAKEIAGAKGIRATAPAGLESAADFKEAQSKGDAAVKELIDKTIRGTSVTVVVIGQNTANLDYVEHAISESLERQNGVLGVFVGANRGAVPFEAEAAALMESGGYETVAWDAGSFAQQLEDAATDWKRFARAKPLGSRG